MTPTVRIIQGAPALVYAWPTPPEPWEVYALECDLCGPVWRASRGRKWDVVAWRGWDRNEFVAGARLSLDGEGYAAIREGEAVLEAVRAKYQAALEGSAEHDVEAA